MDLGSQARFWARRGSERAEGQVARRLTPARFHSLVRSLEREGMVLGASLSPPEVRLLAGDVETVEVAPAASIQLDAYEDLLPEEGYYWPPVSVHFLTQGVLDADSGLVFAAGRVIDESGSGRSDSASDLSFLTGAGRRWRTAEPRHTDASIAPLGETHNYYHFLLESLPRVIRILEQQPGTEFIATEEPPPFARELLARIGATVRVVPTGTQFRSPRILLCSPRPKRFWPHPGDVRLLQTRLAAPARTSDARGGVRLYISRRGSSRSPRDEDGLEAALRGRGFRIVTLEVMPVAEQIATLSAADLVVAPHGAGLANLLFCSPGSTVIELASVRWWEPCFRRLAAMSDLDYRLLLLDSDDHLPWGNAMRALEVLDQWI